MYYNNNDVRLEEMPEPKIGPGELLVKVMASGICGSDVMEWYRATKAPLVLGHEIAGDIVSVGEGVTKFKQGERVFVSHHVPCGICRYCRSGHETVCNQLRTTNFDPGGFAEFIRVPEVNVKNGVFVLPQRLTYEEGTFAEPLGCVVRGQRLAGSVEEKTILVVGSGITGLLHIKLARAHGAQQIIATDVLDYRLKAAERLGADVAFRAGGDVPDRIRERNRGRLAEYVIVCTGTPAAIEQALRSVDSGGTVLFFAPTEPGKAIQIPFNDLWREEVTVLSSYGASPQDITAAIQLLRTGAVRVQDMITHQLGLAETGAGFRLVAEAKQSIKVIIEPQK